MAEEYTNSMAITLGLTDEKNIVGKLDDGMKSFKDALSQSMFKGAKLDLWSKAGDALGSGIKKAGSWALDKLENVLADALDEMDELLRYSLMTDSEVRERKFTYGFSSAQAYGFDKALSMLNISEDDLMYMNPQQSEKFREAFTKYTDKYNQLADSGFFEKQLEYQIEMNEFKEDMKLEVVGFLMENKDLIKDVLTFGMQFMEIGIKAFGWLINSFGQSAGRIGQADAASVLSNYNTKTNNVQITNTFNGIGAKDKTWLANAGQMSYEQIIAQLNQG